jgi:cytidine deaminase
MDGYFKKMYEIGTRGDIASSISEFLSIGQVKCIILSDDNKIYKGVDIIEDNNVFIKAEVSAIAAMLSNGSKYIKKVLVLNELGEVIKPTDESIIYLLDFMNENKIEVLLPDNNKVFIDEIIPDYYGTFRIIEE